jgi:acetyl esterase/lipase
MGLRNTMGEYFSYPALLMGIQKANKGVQAEKVKCGDDKNQYFLCLMPEQVQSKKIIVYIHGGGWKNGNPDEFRFIGNEFSKRGYNTVLLGYRLAPVNKYPAQVEDIFNSFCRAMYFLNQKGVNTDEVVVIGSSAGAHLGAVLAYDKKMHREYGISQSIFKGYCSLGGPIVLEECKNDTIKALMKGLFTKDYDTKLGDPYYMIQGDEEIPVLCIHSSNDPIVEEENSIHFAERVNSLGGGLAEFYIEDDKKIFHSNLVVGMFLKELEATKILYGWLKDLK